MRSRIVGAVLAGAIAGSAGAGDLVATGAGPLSFEEVLPDGRFECTHRFTGPFEPGDAAKIIAAHPSLLCLDSPGGLLAEALELTAWMKEHSLATKVERDAECYSACAVVFMAGSRWPIERRAPFFWRVLVPGGKLGFHAPSLRVEAGVYNEESVTFAYNVSTEFISRIIRDLAMREDLSGPAMRLSLLGEMLATPPQDMLVIETVDQAGRWDIHVGPLAEGDWPPSPPALAQICVNAQRWANQLSAQQDWLPIFEQWDHETDARTLSGFVLLNEISSDGCTMWVDRQPGPSPLTMEMVHEGTVFYKRLMRYPASTLLADLPLDDGDAVVGACIVMRNGAENDRNTCREERRPDGEVLVRVFSWPSGAQTVIEENPLGDTHINGVYTYSEDQGDRVCWHNSDSGNTFCFERS